MSTDIVKQIPHVATKYELEAAARGELRAIIVPADEKILQLRSLPIYEIDGTTSLRQSINPRFFQDLGIELGDRLYLQEEWCDYDGDYLLRVKPDCEVSEHEDGWMSWRGA
ncbi:MAG: hypothetical protein ACRC62_21945, partial [Microcoleus sp.]